MRQGYKYVETLGHRRPTRQRQYNHKKNGNRYKFTLSFHAGSTELCMYWCPCPWRSWTRGHWYMSAELRLLPFSMTSFSIRSTSRQASWARTPGNDRRGQILEVWHLSSGHWVSSICPNYAWPPRNFPKSVRTSVSSLFFAKFVRIGRIWPF